MAGLHTLHAVSPQPQTLSEKHLDFLSLLGKVTFQSKTHCKSGLCLGTNKTLPPPLSMEQRITRKQECSLCVLTSESAEKNPHGLPG